MNLFINNYEIDCTSFNESLRSDIADDIISITECINKKLGYKLFKGTFMSNSNDFTHINILCESNVVYISFFTFADANSYPIKIDKLMNDLMDISNTIDV